MLGQKPATDETTATEASEVEVSALPSQRNEPAAKLSPSSAGTTALSNEALLERAGVMKVDQNGGPLSTRADQFASFQTDAPSCDNCGAITVRNGNCYLCHNCGNSMGCS
jgi:ribonucleoside-diphosphate reductase alpha chain